jgi:molybdate transport system ATP-binding protein
VTPVIPAAPSSDAVIKIKNLHVKYADKVVIENFNWTVNKGDRWALMGRNGSGKTTLFSIIFADHPQAYAHEIYLFGKRRGTGESIWDIKRRINYLGPEQISYLNASSFLMTARQYLVSQHINLNNERLTHLVTFFCANDFLQKLVKNLSSGELQLLMIVNCFLSEKELWLLDEPFQFLDDDRKQKVSQYLEKQLQKDITVIMITHYDQDRLTWTDKRMQL